MGWAAAAGILARLLPLSSETSLHPLLSLSLSLSLLILCIFKVGDRERGSLTLAPDVVRPTVATPRELVCEGSSAR